MGKSYLYRTDFIALQMTNLNISFGFRFIDSLIIPVSDRSHCK
jgi:hypothetical protein